MIIYKSIESDKDNDNQNMAHKTPEIFQTICQYNYIYIVILHETLKYLCFLYKYGIYKIKLCYSFV